MDISAYSRRLILGNETEFAMSALLMARITRESGKTLSAFMALAVVMLAATVVCLLLWVGSKRRLTDLNPSHAPLEIAAISSASPAQQSRSFNSAARNATPQVLKGTASVAVDITRVTIPIRAKHNPLSPWVVPSPQDSISQQVSVKPIKAIEPPALPAAPEITYDALAANRGLASYFGELPTNIRANVAAPRRSVSGEEHAIIATLQKYSQAWSTKDLANITALRPGLSRRTVKDELNSARSIFMSIRPAAAPKIEGNRATVACVHQVNQIFDDGAQKQSPGVPMTYVLVKHGNDWLISDTR